MTSVGPFIFILPKYATQSRNCDGGYQEMSTAVECVRTVFPDCEIETQRNDSYPIRVIISARVGNDNNKAKELEVWSGRQQDLFSKYATKRRQTMETIKANLMDLQERLEDE